MATDLPLLMGAVGLVRGTVKGLGPALSQLSYEISSDLAGNHNFSVVPFNCISLIVRYGRESIPEPEIGRINSHKELEVAVYVSIDELRSTRGEVEMLKKLLKPYVHHALTRVFEKYDSN